MSWENLFCSMRTTKTQTSLLIRVKNVKNTVFVFQLTGNRKYSFWDAPPPFNKHFISHTTVVLHYKWHAWLREGGRLSKCSKTKLSRDMRFSTMWYVRPSKAYAQSDQSLWKSLEYSMTLRLLTEQHLEFLSLKGGCTGSSESTLVKIPHCWKSHVVARILTNVMI